MPGNGIESATADWAIDAVCVGAVAVGLRLGSFYCLNPQEPESVVLAVLICLNRAEPSVTAKCNRKLTRYVFDCGDLKVGKSSAAQQLLLFETGFRFHLTVIVSDASVASAIALLSAVLS